MNTAEQVAIPLAWVAGAGYLGSCLYEQLIANGWDALRLDIRPERADACVDTADFDALRRAGLPEPQVIFCCVSATGGTDDDYRHVYSGTVDAMQKICPKVRLVFCSSASVYGVTDASLVTEETQPTLRSVRTQMLYEAECQVRCAGGVAARLSALYGSGRSYAVQRYLAGEDVLAGDDDRWINYIHREDAAAALILLAEQAPDGSVWNVSDGTPMQKGQLLSLLWETTGLPLPRGEARAYREFATDQRIFPDKLRRLGWLPAYPCFAAALKEVLEAMLPDEG